MIKNHGNAKDFVNFIALAAPLIRAQDTSFVNYLVVNYFSFVDNYAEILGYRAFPVDRQDNLADIFWKNFSLVIGGYFPNVTNFLMGFFAEETPIYNDPERYKVLFGHFPSGSSYNSAAYINQGLRGGGKFKEFDYGTTMLNIEAYG